MVKKKEILSILRDTLRRRLRKGNQKIERSTPLLNHPDLDSLELVSYIVDVEQRLKEKHKLEISLADERAMSRSRSPFRNIGTLLDYICELVGEVDA